MSKPANARGGLFLFIGPDRARKLERIEAIATARQVHLLDQHRLNAADVSASSLLALIRAYPALSPVRLVIVDDAQRLDAACVKGVAGYADAVSHTACLILLVDGEVTPTHPLATLTPHATIEQFASPLPQVTPESFALVNAIARRDLGAALGAMQDQLASGKEVLELLGRVIWQLQRWLLVEHLLEAGTALGRIADLTGIRPGQLERIRVELAGRSLASLRRALQACWQLDVSAKRGQVPLLRVALEQVVVELCLPRPFEMEKGRGRPAPVAPRQTRVSAKASFAVADE